MLHSPARKAAMTALLLVLLVLLLPSRAVADESLWALLKGGGQVILLRHAVTAPGVGDPPGFRLDDCATQRNLTDAGRAEARRVGAAFRARAIPVGRVLSSPWCRCLETARLAFGRAEQWAPLSNLFGNRAREAEQLQPLREIAGRRPEGGNLVLVTHGSVVRPLTGISPAPAELVVLTPAGPGRFTAAGRLPVDAIR
jgi:broad specificity phosphatase PhoE